MKTIVLMMLMLAAICSASSQPITKMEYFMDTDPGFGNGTDIPVTPSNDVSANFNIDLTGLESGVHQLMTRVKNSNNEWSIVTVNWFYCYDPVIHADITQMEYFFDTDPGFGAGKQVPVVPGKIISGAFTLDTAGLTLGVHMLSIRTKNMADRWSVVSSFPFLNLNPDLPDIVQLEYFLDYDPGFGAGIQVPIIPGQSISANLIMDTTGLSQGRHFLVVRAKNTKNDWGVVGYQEFSIFKTKLFLEGLYVTSTGMMNPAQAESGNQWGPDIADHITLQLHDQNPPYNIVFEEESALATNGIATLIIPQHLEQTFVGVKHRNSIETWSTTPISIPSLTTPYDFTSSFSMAYGDNMKDAGDGNFAFWGGDVNQDGIVDAGDMNPVDNASTSITFGYVPEDVNGDGIVDGGDMNIVDNNSTAIVIAFLP